MSLKLKAVLLIALLAGHEGARVANKVSRGNRIKNAAGFSQESQQEDASGTEVASWYTGCDADVMVQAVIKSEDADTSRVKIDVRVPKDAFEGSEIVEVGSQTENDCETTYSLLCKDDKITLRQEAKECGSPPEDGHFSWVKIWRSTPHGAFTFSPKFLQTYDHGSALKDADVVHFTPTTNTCDNERTKIAESQEKLNEAVDSLENIKDKGEFKKSTAMLKPFQKAKMGYDKMGCPGSGTSESIPGGMVNKLRETFVKALANLCAGAGEDEAQKCGGNFKDNAKQRFDDMLELVKQISAPSMKEAIKAAEIALGTKVIAEGGEDEEDGSEEVEDDDTQGELEEGNEEELEDELQEVDSAGELPPALQMAAGKDGVDINVIKEKLQMDVLQMAGAKSSGAKSTGAAGSPQSSTLVQLQQGQVKEKGDEKGDIPSALQVASFIIVAPFMFGGNATKDGTEAKLTKLIVGFFALIAVVVTIFVLFWPAAMWFLISAVIIGAGLITWKAVQGERRRAARQAARKNGGGNSIGAYFKARDER